MKQFLVACGHEITDGTPYQWKSYGPKARFINCDNDFASCYIIFDTVTQVIFEIAVQSETETANYRWINPDFLEAYRAEAKKKKIAWDNPGDPTEADFEEGRWRLTDTTEDITDKAYAIRNGIPYDPRVVMTLYLDNEVIAIAALRAHESGMLLNDYIVNLLTHGIALLAAENKAAKKAKKAAKKG